MPRPTKAFGLCALALAFVMPTSSSDVVRAGARSTETISFRSAASDAARTARCSTWSSTVMPPRTIRVYREAYGPAEGTVQVVPFRKWAEYVLGTQMPAYYPIEALRANAIAVKQYGWYYVLHWRGGRAPTGDCYDVADTGDGFYRPEVYSPAAQHVAAMAVTWHFTLRKRDWQTGESRMFLTGYRAGAHVACGADSDGWHLYQHSAFQCGKDGHTWEGILRQYMEPNLEIVEPGVTNVIGSRHGDATALSAEGLALRTRVYRSTGTSFHKAGARLFDLDPASILGVVAADVTDDRRSDLLVLQRSGRGAKLLVLRSDGTRYLDPETWWTDRDGIGTRDPRLVAGDFDGDGIVDAGIVAQRPDGLEATFHVLRSVRTSFKAPRRYWIGQLDLQTARVYGGDPTGDGRADLVVERDLGANGMEYLVAASRLNGVALSNPKRWYRNKELRRETTLTAIGDYDRDGRDDVLLALPDGLGTRVVGLKADARAASGFVRETLWKSSSRRPIALRKVKLSAGDVNSDGRADALLWIDLGTRGTRLYRLRTNDRGDAMGSGVFLDDAALDWDAARPY